MIVFIPLVPREDAKKEVQEKYKYSVLFAKLGSKKLKAAINENEKINGAKT